MSNIDQPNATTEPDLTRTELREERRSDAYSSRIVSVTGIGFAPTKKRDLFGPVRVQSRRARAS